MKRALCASLLMALVAACGTDGNGRATPSPGSSAAIGERAASISGTVLDAATATPLPDVTVEAPGGVSVRSDARGRFRLTGLPVGATGDLVATTSDGHVTRNPLRPLRAGVLEVVIHVRRP